MGQADSLRGQREELEARKDRTTDRLVHLKRILGTICLTKRVHCRCIIYCTPEMPFLYLKVEIFNLPTILEINSNPTFILFCFGKLGNLKYCLREKQGKRRHVLTFFALCNVQSDICAPSLYKINDIPSCKHDFVRIMCFAQ